MARTKTIKCGNRGCDLYSKTLRKKEGEEEGKKRKRIGRCVADCGRRLCDEHGGTGAGWFRKCKGEGCDKIICRDCGKCAAETKGVGEGGFTSALPYSLFYGVSHHQRHLKPPTQLHRNTRTHPLPEINCLISRSPPFLLVKLNHTTHSRSCMHLRIPTVCYVRRRR